MEECDISTKKENRKFFTTKLKWKLENIFRTDRAHNVEPFKKPKKYRISSYYARISPRVIFFHQPSDILFINEVLPKYMTTNIKHFTKQED